MWRGCPPSTLGRMSATLWQDLLSRLGGQKPGPASDDEPDVAVEPGVRVVDGELRYSDMWLDEETGDEPEASADLDDTEL
jgi:hypothetical protein